MKSLFKNSVYYILYRLINVIYPLITATYVSRVLKPAGVGDAALAQSIVIFLVAVALLGIPNYGVREVSRSDADEAGRIFSELFVMNLVSTVIISALYFTTVNVLELSSDRTLSNIYGIILALNVINVDWFYQGKEDFKYITIRSAVVKLISIIAIFTFVKTEDDIYAYATIFAMAYAGNYIFNAINLRKYVRLSFRGINVKRHMKGVFALAITAISNEIYVTLDTFMLGLMSSNVEIGYYSNSMKLMRILINVVTALGTVILPRLSKLNNDADDKAFSDIANKAVKMLLWITLPCTIGLMIMASPIVVVLFGADFAPASVIFVILSLLVVPRAFSNMSLQILVGTGEENITSKVYFTGMILNCFLNLSFIPLIGARGAAIASVISEVYICLVMLFFSRKKFALSISRSFIASFIVSGITMSAGVIAVSRLTFMYVVPLTVRLIAGIAAGIILYVSVSCLLKNEVSIYLLSKVKKVMHIK